MPKNEYRDAWDDVWMDINMDLYAPAPEVTVIEVEKRGVGRPMAEPGDITDITSTGRKRAAMLYPIFENMKCEWAGLKFAGGGVEPIIGCDNHIIQPTKGPDKGDRHHGPDKNVINNSPGNVHRVCSSCHNRWHANNNKYYGDRPTPDQPFLPKEDYDWTPHDSETFATPEEITDNERYWNKNKKLLIDVDTE